MIVLGRSIVAINALPANEANFSKSNKATIVSNITIVIAIPKNNHNNQSDVYAEAMKMVTANSAVETTRILSHCLVSDQKPTYFNQNES